MFWFCSGCFVTNRHADPVSTPLYLHIRCLMKDLNDNNDIMMSIYINIYIYINKPVNRINLHVCLFSACVNASMCAVASFFTSTHITASILLFSTHRKWICPDGEPDTHVVPSACYLHACTCACLCVFVTSCVYLSWLQQMQAWRSWMLDLRMYIHVYLTRVCDRCGGAGPAAVGRRCGPGRCAVAS